jgi:hypothetical protein
MTSVLGPLFAILIAFSCHKDYNSWPEGLQGMDYKNAYRTGPDQTLYTVTPMIGNQAGGDYISIRQTFPDMKSFCPSTYIGIKGPVYHPYYFHFKP